MYVCMVFDFKYRCVSIFYIVYVNNCFEMLMNFFFFIKKLIFLKNVLLKIRKVFINCVKIFVW